MVISFELTANIATKNLQTRLSTKLLLPVIVFETLPAVVLDFVLASKSRYKVPKHDRSFIVHFFEEERF